MTNCENCHGEGLVGQGDQPWLQQGRIETCVACGGTGQVDDEIVSGGAPTVAPEEPVNTLDSAPVDNDPLAQAPSDAASSDGSNGANVASEEIR